MPTQAITLRLPLPVYEFFKNRAERTHRSVEGELLEVATTEATEKDRLSLDLAQAVAGLAVLDDEDLWRAARSRLPIEQKDQIEALNYKQQSEGLTQAERQRQEQLLSACDRVMLVRAHAAKLLKVRGHDISELLGAR